MTDDATKSLGTLRDMKNLVILWVIETNQRAPEEVVDYLNPAEDGEACEKAHRASYQTQLGLHGHLKIMIKSIINVMSQCHLHIPFDLIVGCRVKEDVDCLKWWILQWQSGCWKHI